MEFPKWTDSFFQDDDNAMLPWRNGFTVPAVNIAEDADAYTVEVAAPGMKKGDFMVNVERGMLVVEAEAKSIREAKESNYTRQEFSHTSFKRSFMLPENVSTAGISAKYENGLLMIRLPKSAVMKPEAKKTVTIN